MYICLTKLKKKLLIIDNWCTYLLNLLWHLAAHFQVSINKAMPRPKSIAPVPQVHCRSGTTEIACSRRWVVLRCIVGYCGYFFPVLALYQTAMSPAHAIKPSNQSIESVVVCSTCIETWSCSSRLPLQYQPGISSVPLQNCDKAYTRRIRVAGQQGQLGAQRAPQAFHQFQAQRSNGIPDGCAESWITGSPGITHEASWSRFGKQTVLLKGIRYTVWLHFVVLAANSNRAGLSGTTVLSPPLVYLGYFSLRRVGQLLHPGNSSTTVDMDNLWNVAPTLEDLLISARTYTLGGRSGVTTGSMSGSRMNGMKPRLPWRFTLLKRCTISLTWLTWSSRGTRRRSQVIIGQRSYVSAVVSDAWLHVSNANHDPLCSFSEFFGEDHGHFPHLMFECTKIPGSVPIDQSVAVGGIPSLVGSDSTTKKETLTVCRAWQGQAPQGCETSLTTKDLLAEVLPCC